MGLVRWPLALLSSKKMSGVRSLRNELREFVLENVELVDDERVLGTGSYGSVQEVRLYKA